MDIPPLVLLSLLAYPCFLALLPWCGRYFSLWCPVLADAPAYTLLPRREPVRSSTTTPGPGYVEDDVERARSVKVVGRVKFGIKVSWLYLLSPTAHACTHTLLPCVCVCVYVCNLFPRPSSISQPSTPAPSRSAQGVVQASSGRHTRCGVHTPIHSRHSAHHFWRASRALEQGWQLVVSRPWGVRCAVVRGSGHEARKDPAGDWKVEQCCVCVCVCAPSMTLECSVRPREGDQCMFWFCHTMVHGERGTQRNDVGAEDGQRVHVRWGVVDTTGYTFDSSALGFWMTMRR